MWRLWFLYRGITGVRKLHTVPEMATSVVSKPLHSSLYVYCTVQLCEHYPFQFANKTCKVRRRFGEKLLPKYVPEPNGPTRTQIVSPKENIGNVCALLAPDSSLCIPEKEERNKLRTHKSIN